jgi:hypothetical protein
MTKAGILLIAAVSVLPAGQFSIRLAGSAQPDCSSVEEIVAAVTRGAGSDREKALALHRFGMAHFIHFDGPKEERDEYVTDPMKLIGVYGYALCGNNSSAMNALYNAAGLKARKLSVPGHSIPEVWFEGKWNYIDTDMFGYVFLPDGRIASVDELVKEPELFLKQKNPPDPYYPFDEKDAMASVFRNAKPHPDYHPYANAHLMNLGLRTGESARLFYRPQGRGRYFLSPDFRKDLGTVYKDYWVTGPVRLGSLAWTDKPPAAYGNGLLEYHPDLRSEAFAIENPRREGITIGREKGAPPLSASAKDQPASLIVKVTTPWVISGLQNDLIHFGDETDGAVVSGLFWRPDASDETRILVSIDKGQTWQKAWQNLDYLGAVPFHVDLTRFVNGEYGYWLKFEWVDRKGRGRVGLEDLKVKTWVELSPMGLPRIAAGKNTFRLSTKPLRAFYNQSRWDRGQPLPGQQTENLAAVNTFPYLRPQDGSRTGVLTFPAGTDGTLEELRVSIRARALRGSQGLSIALSLSEDGGATWRELERFEPHPEHRMNAMWFNHVIRNAQLNGAACKLKLTISGGGLDQVIANSLVREVPASPGPLRITHLWQEGNRSRTAVHNFVPGSRESSYEVTAAGPELMNQELRIEALAKQ